MGGDGRRSQAADREVVASIWAAAFASDPIIRWFLPDDRTYGRKARALFSFIFDIRHEGGEVWVYDGLAAAGWTPPGGLAAIVPSPQERWQAMTDVFEPDELDRVTRYNEELYPLLPRFDNWYLGVLGTAPGHQGQGYGRRVIAPVMAKADGAGVPQSLETAVRSNRRFYERLGFEVTRTLELDDAPAVWVMVREPGAGEAPSAAT